MPTVDERSIYIPPAARAAPGRRKNIHKTRFSAASAICRRSAEKARLPRNAAVHSAARRFCPSAPSRKYRFIPCLSGAMRAETAMVSKIHAAALTAGLSSFDTEDSAEVTAEALSRSRAPAVMNPPATAAAARQPNITAPPAPESVCAALPHTLICESFIFCHRPFFEDIISLIFRKIPPDNKIRRKFILLLNLCDLYYI